MSVDLFAPHPQQRAADPGLSAFVTANAGSGKTKTLIDRVARLLLADVKPEAILCVTYTKAAAAEMQRRLFDRLGAWSVLPDVDLAKELEALQDRSVQDLSGARSLFAKALETPGGLKIQTIHAFCEKLLRRFPLEAGVSPGFRVLDDAASAAVAAVARADVAHHALTGEGAVSEAYARFSVALAFQHFQEMFADFETRRGPLAAFLGRVGGLEGAEAWVWDAVDLPPRTDPDDIAAAAMAGLDRDLLREAAEALIAGKSHLDVAQRLAVVANDASPTPYADLLRAFFTRGGEGDPARWIEQAATLKARPGLQGRLLAERERLADARLDFRAAGVAWDTVHALTLAEAYLTAYRAEKTHAGALDFTDLIEKTRALLSSREATAWVLYKLDGGIDHILVDEAQDTALDQWAIVRALTDEFFSGEGVRGEGASRQMFVVGDEKQSIYSFQGARPEQLAAEFDFHSARARKAGFTFEQIELRKSYRSTPQVLRFVDSVFARAQLAQAIQPGAKAARVTHDAHRRTDPGCVDLWAPVMEGAGDDRLAWDAPVDAEGETSANRKLARMIAREVDALIARGDAIYDKDLDADGRKGGWRAANAGDVLILVRRRGALFEEILRALKQAGLPVAGADRLVLSQHIVFDDLMALARFVQHPADELNLAALLRSPFCGLSDQDLYDLAHERGRENLWRRLREREGQSDAFGAAARLLGAALELGRSVRPYEFYARFLATVDADGRSLRGKVLKRLGAEAEEPLDEYLAQVLSAEGRGVNDLESLAHDFASLDITVKREMEAPAGQVRVMTAHGAKGLEAPIVFLPETTMTRGGRASPLMETDDGGFLWSSGKDRDCTASAAARARRNRLEDAEAFRLLYVALTRARDRLVLCARVGAGRKPEGWYVALDDAMKDPQIAPRVRTIENGQRYGEDPVQMGALAGVAPTADASLPAWTGQSVPPEAFARYASPSHLGEDALTPAASPLAVADGGLGRFRRGDLIHRLLQVLPDLAAERWDAAAAALLARETDLTDDQRAEMAAAALLVLRDPAFAEVFGPGSRAEVSIAGAAAALPAGLNVSGRIDRLVVLEDRVLVADFKTNRPSPARIEDADPAYLRQMAIYAAVIGEVFPGRRIEAALVWTDGPKLMPIPEILLAQSLADLGRAG